MRLLSSSLCGQLIVREVQGNMEAEASQPRSCLTPFSSSGSCPSPPVPSVNARALCDQPGSCPAQPCRDTAANADFPQEGARTRDLALLLPRVASGEAPLPKHGQQAENREACCRHSLRPASRTGRRGEGRTRAETGKHARPRSPRAQLTQGEGSEG